MTEGSHQARSREPDPPGARQVRNEDSFLQGQWLFAVADGLGGHVAGDVASTTAIEAMSGYDRPVRPEDLVRTAGRARTA